MTQQKPPPVVRCLHCGGECSQAKVWRFGSGPAVLGGLLILGWLVSLLVDSAPTKDFSAEIVAGLAVWILPIVFVLLLSRRSVWRCGACGSIHERD